MDAASAGFTEGNLGRASRMGYPQAKEPAAEGHLVGCCARCCRPLVAQALISATPIFDPRSRLRTDEAPKFEFVWAVNGDGKYHYVL